MDRGRTSEEDQSRRYAAYNEMDDEKFYLFKVYDIINNLQQRKKFKNVLDVGCADGSFLEKISKEFGFNPFGIDVSDGAVKRAKKRGIDARKHNVEKKFPFNNNFFDLVISCEVIEHLYDTDFFLSELHRILKKNGILILSTPNLASLVNRIKLFLGKYPSYVPEYRVGGAGHVRAYTLPALSGQLRDNGFKIMIETSPNVTFPMVNPSVPHGLKKAAIRMGDVFPKFGSHIIVVSSK